MGHLKPLVQVRLLSISVSLRNIESNSAEAKKKKKKKKPKKKKLEQSDPPRIGLSKFYPDGNYPVGEIQEYKDEQVLFFFSHLLAFNEGVVTHGEQRTRKKDTSSALRTKMKMILIAISAKQQKFTGLSVPTQGRPFDPECP
jgi:hypothetical protein